MVTGVFSKDVIMIIRKNHTSLPEYEMNSTVVQPNHDGSFQIRKTVEIEEDDDDEAEYDCLMSHRTLNKSIIVTWDGLCSECPLNTVAAGFVGVVVGGVLVLAVSALVFGILVERKIIEKHSLYYIYTALSKPVDLPGIYEFSAMGLLDDTQIDYYNSEKKRMIPKQSWMREKLPVDYWDKNTQSTVGKELCFNMDVQIVMDRMKHNKSDLHVLQLRQGCEVELQGDEVKFLKGISEYGYDGGNFLSFDINESQWVAPVVAALPTKRKWDNMPINQYTKGYLEKECVDWLKKYREYRDENLRNTSPPDVYMFAKMYIKYKTRLKLTCMATGFYHQDLIMNIRKYRASLPEHETKSTGTRPNHDGSFQLRKSVKIKEGDERAVYYCWVSHRTLKEPIINIWDGKCWDCPPETPTGAVIGARIGAGIGAGIEAVIKAVIEAVIGAGIGVVLVLAAFGLAVFKRINGRESTGEISDVIVSSSREDLYPLTPAEKMASVPEQLLQILDDLDSYNLKRFKWYLKQRGLVSASLLENADNIDIVDQMVNSFEQNEALEHTVDILKMMNQNQLAEKLIKNYKVLK